YDIVEAGYKCNMTDITAAIGIVELGRYDSETLVRRKQIVDAYNVAFAADRRCVIPIFETEEKIGSYRCYPLSLREATEEQRDRVIQEIFDREVSVNVHFLPVPATTFYRDLSYDVNNYPVALDNYRREISLPVFYDMTDDQVKQVVKAVYEAVNT